MVWLRNEHRIISLKYCVWYRSHSWHTILLLWRWFDCKFYPKTCFCISLSQDVIRNVYEGWWWRNPLYLLHAIFHFLSLNPYTRIHRRQKKVKDYLHFVNNINISIVIWPIYFIFWYFESIIYLFTLLFICFLFLHIDYFSDIGWCLQEECILLVLLLA